MDRNLILPLSGALCGVALRKESVDRNVLLVNGDAPSSVALRKESVDRNIISSVSSRCISSSLSARRAWIEIQIFRTLIQHHNVALRKESVDRNSAGRKYETKG